MAKLKPPFVVTDLATYNLVETSGKQGSMDAFGLTEIPMLLIIPGMACRRDWLAVAMSTPTWETVNSTHCWSSFFRPSMSCCNITGSFTNKSHSVCFFNHISQCKCKLHLTVSVAFDGSENLPFRQVNDFTQRRTKANRANSAIGQTWYIPTERLSGGILHSSAKGSRTLRASETADLWLISRSGSSCLARGRAEYTLAPLSSMKRKSERVLIQVWSRARLSVDILFQNQTYSYHETFFFLNEDFHINYESSHV